MDRRTMFALVLRQAIDVLGTSRDPVRDFRCRHGLETTARVRELRAVLRGEADAPLWLLHLVEADMVQAAQRGIDGTIRHAQADAEILARVKGRHGAPSARS